MDAWFSDVDPPRQTNLWSTLYASVIITSRRVRHLKDTSWVTQTISLVHSDLGGTSDGSWVLHVYVKDLGFFAFEPRRVSSQDLSSVLDTLQEGRPCPPPKTLTSQTPAVCQLRPKTFHSSGLIPWSIQNLFVIVPCIFSPTGWVRRRLSHNEWLAIMDIPRDKVASLNGKEINSLLNSNSFFPLKVSTAILDSLRLTQSWNNTKKQKLSHDNATLENWSVPTHEQNPDFNLSNDPLTEKDRTTRNTKAAKNDDAEVPVFLWDEAIIPDGNASSRRALNRLRCFALGWWKRRTTRDFLQWMKCRHPRTDSPDYCLDLEAGRDCISRCANSEWWEWTAGSRPLFWRWPEEYRTIIRDGVPPWIKGTLPHYKVPQRNEKDPAIRTVIKKKLKSVIDKGYLIPGIVHSLTSFFTVPKGEGDVRMVYDGTKSGLNSMLWAPWFPLPTIDTHLRSVSEGYYMGDIDFSEQFLNFILHEKVRSHAGVDVTLFFPELVPPDGHVLWLHWGRCGMGFVSSPYNSVQGTLMGEEVIRGDHTDPNNIFFWEDVILNLPGSDSYLPSKPWVFKACFPEKSGSPRIANDLVIYVDDVRTTGSTYAQCRQASRTVASKANYLGLQDAARKRRDPSQTPGPWAGCIVHTDADGVEVSVSVERWSKAKAMLVWLDTSLKASNELDHKTLESYRGYLVYISRTYPNITPYLKGIHLTLDSWRPWRAEDSWKLSISEIKVAVENKGVTWTDVSTGGKAPQRVKAAPRLYDDVKALLTLFAAPTPPRRPVRPNKFAEATYMFGDASGTGFGSSLLVHKTIHFTYGQWVESNSRESSNFRELQNLVNAIKEAHGEGLLNKTELFVFTDNITAESAFFKGTSSSRKLFDLILDLRKLQMDTGMIIHMIHVSGLRMISQGTDGLSRGSSLEGIMRGSPFLSYVPLHLSALERQGDTLKEWILSWFSGKDEPLILSPKDWFTRGHHHSTCIWIPPPAAADVALEQLAYSIHKRPSHIHLMLVPRLLTSRWRKYLGKVMNFLFTIPLGSTPWRDSHHEPLIAGLYFPLSKHRPWNLRGTIILERAERLLREMSSSHPRWGRLVLRQLLQQTRQLETLPSSMVRELLRPSGSK